MSSIRMSASRSVQSGGSVWRMRWKSVARPIGRSLATEEELEEQEGVEADDQGGEHTRERAQPPRVRQVAHHLAVSGDEQQRDEGEGDAEGEDHLAADEGVGGV